MKIEMFDGLSIVSVSLTYKGKTMCLHDALQLFLIQMK